VPEARQPAPWRRRRRRRRAAWPDTPGPRFLAAGRPGTCLADAPRRA